jgi:hypothetical protein
MQWRRQAMKVKMSVCMDCGALRCCLGKENLEHCGVEICLSQFGKPWAQCSTAFFFGMWRCVSIHQMAADLWKGALI